MRDASKGQGGHQIGEIVGDRLLYSYEGLSPHRHHLWLYQCLNCSELNGPDTISHIKRAKYCPSCRTGKNHPTFVGYEDIKGSYIGSIKYGAKKRQITYSVSNKELWNQWLTQGGCCYYSGLKLTHGVDASLDRRKNEFGYVKSNILWVHKDVNRIKSDFTEDYFLTLCKLIAINQIKGK